MTEPLLGWFTVVVLPVLLGLGLSRTGPRGLQALTALLILAIVATTSSDALPPASELLGPTLFAGLGLAIGRLAVPRAIAWTTSLLVTFLLAEGLGRLVLDPAPPMPTSTDTPWASQRDRIARDPRAMLDDEACDLAFGPPRAAAGRPWVVHLGDSMVRGTDQPLDAPPGASLQRSWQAVWPDASHTMHAASGTSVDVGRLALDRLLPSHPDLVLWYLFPFNDAQELGLPWPCCPGGPLLEDVTGPPRCEEPHPHAPTGLRNAMSLPWPLRRLAHTSRVAGWLCVAWIRALHPEPFQPPRPWSAVAAVVAQGARAAEQAGVTLRLVILPDTGDRLRPSMADQEPALRDALERADLVPLVLPAPLSFSDDALEALLAPDGVHFHAHGYDVLAAALAPHAQRALSEPVTPR